jgi:ABC-2 type transport system permease protein
MSPLARAADDVRLYAVLAGAGIRAQMQYRASFAIRMVTDAFGIVADFVTIALLVNRFGAVQGWALPELALLYGMVGVSWGLVELGLRGFEEFGQFLLAGELDRWLLRPRGVLLQIAGSHFEPHRLGRIAQAAVVLAAALVALDLPASGVAWVAVGVAGGVVFFAGIVQAGAATQFWTLGQTSELQNMLTYGGTASLSYPVSIYERWFRRILTFGVPMAFVNYYPALAALGRADGDPAATAAAWAAPFVCVGVALAGSALFRRGLRRYESSGT